MSGVPEELVLRYLDGAATVEETATLEQLLRSDPEARRDFVRQSHLHGLFAELARGPLILVRPKRRWPLWTSLGAAAAAILAASLWLIGGEPAAIIDSCDGGIAWTHRGHERAATAGAKLAAGDRLVLADGAHAMVTWPDGARVSIDAGSDLVIAVPSARLRLDHGAVRAEISAHDPRHPFAIATPEALATDVGTVFSVRRRGESTRVEVVAGTVELAAGGATVTVPAGRRAVAAAGHPPRLVVPVTPPPIAVPTTVAGWHAPAPEHRRLDALPPSLAELSWRTEPALSVSVSTDGAAMVPVVRRGNPAGVVGEAPVPDLAPARRGIAGTSALFLIDQARQQAWQCLSPEFGRAGLLVRELKPATIAEAEHSPPLFGLLLQRDLHGEDAHALAVLLPAEALDGDRLRLGDRLVLAPEAPRPADAVGARLADLLSTHGAIIVGREARPTLAVEMQLPAEQRGAVDAALPQLAPSLRRCRVEVVDDDE